MQIVVATRNPSKSREFREMLQSGQISWSDLSAYPHVQEVEETGRTFRANACLKASGYALQTAQRAMAGDSGLEIDALGGAPGVASARWAMLQGTGKGDADNNSTVLKQLESVADNRRSARFVCVLALANPNGQILLTTREVVEGRILREPRGNNGFGYDPLFFIDSLGQTTAELSADRKHQISHRGKALRRMRELMRRAGIAQTLYEPTALKVQ